MTAEQNEGVGAALALIPSGVGVVTVAHDGQSAGMLASWVQQVGFDPPAVCVAIKKSRAIEPLLHQAGAFVHNVIGKDDGEMMGRFGKGVGPAADAFAGAGATQRDCGWVLPSAVGHLACRVTARHDAGDHWLYVATVEFGDAAVGAQPYVHIRKTGWNY